MAQNPKQNEIMQSIKKTRDQKGREAEKQENAQQSCPRSKYKQGLEEKAFVMDGLQ